MLAQLLGDTPVKSDEDRIREVSICFDFDSWQIKRYYILCSVLWLRRNGRILFEQTSGLEHRVMPQEFADNKQMEWLFPDSTKNLAKLKMQFKAWSFSDFFLLII